MNPTNVDFSFGGVTSMPFKTNTGQYSYRRMEGDLRDARRASEALAKENDKLAEDAFISRDAVRYLADAHVEAVHKEKIARECLAALREKHLASASAKMDADTYDRGIRLEEENEELKKKKAADAADIAALRERIGVTTAEVLSKDHEIHTLINEKDHLVNSIDFYKSKLEAEKGVSKSNNEASQKAYAELKYVEAEQVKVQKAREDAELRAKELELELLQMHTQLGEAQSTIEHLESQTTRLQDLERDHDALNDELDANRKRYEEHDRTIHVKDARIQHLEAQYQKALEGKLSAEAAAAAATHTEELPAFTSGEDTLQDELEATSDFDDSLYNDPLDFSGVAEVASIAPVNVNTTVTSTQTDERKTTTSSAQTGERQTTASSTQTHEDEAVSDTNSLHSLFSEPTMTIPGVTEVASIAPVKVNTTVTSTQTDERKTIASSTQTQEDEAVSNTDSLYSLSTDTIITICGVTEVASMAPVYNQTTVSSTQTQERQDTSASIQTEAPVISTAAVQTIPVTSAVSTQTVPAVEVATDTKQSAFFKADYMTWLFVALALLFWLQLHAFKTANRYGAGSDYYARGNSRMGAFGNGRYLFGLFPVGFDIGGSWVSEQMCRQTSVAIATFENWLGAQPSALY